MSKIINVSNLNKTIRYFKRNGISSTFYAALERMEQKKHEYSYIEPDKAILDEQRAYEFGFRPLITVVMPAYNTPEPFFREAVESVIGQTYSNWELIIADASENEELAKYTETYASDNRVKYVRLTENGGISANTNAAIMHASGDYIALLDHDDLLCVDALFYMADAIVNQGWTDENPSNGPVIVYSDEDKYDSDTGIYFDPHVKYLFNYDYLLSNNYICHLMCIRRDILNNISFRSEYDGAQDFDIVLQIVNKLIADGIAVAKLGDYILHVGRILYHWRSHAASTAENTDSKGYAYEAGLRAVKTHLNERGIKNIDVEHSRHLGFYKVKYADYETLSDIRPEIGAFIGRVSKSGKMSKCLLDRDGNWLYAGLNLHFAGDFNRFDCMQNVYAADIRYMRLSKACEELLEEKKKTDPEFRTQYERYMGGSVSASETEKIEFLMNIGQILSENGLLICYIPDFKL